MEIRTCYDFTPVQPSSPQDTTLQQVLQMQRKYKNGDSLFYHLILLMLKLLLQEKLLTFVEIHYL